MSIELVVTDLDGTFWDVDDVVHPMTVAAVAELETRGIPLLVATGRRYQSTATPLARAGLAPPAVLLNGGLCLRLADGARFHQRAFEPAEASAALEAWLAAGVDPVLYVDHPDIDVVVSASPSSHPDHLAALAPRVAVADLRQTVEQLPILALAVIGCDEEMLRGVSVAMASAVAATEMFVPAHGRFPGCNLHHWPHGLSKWDGVVAYCDSAGLDPGSVLAVGDNVNDLELLSSAAVACAPTISHESVLALADHVVGDPADGGWAEILDLL